MSRYTCKECQKGFDIYSTYYSHLTRHKPPHKKCQFCTELFYTNGDLYKHSWKYHRPEKSADVRPDIRPMMERLHTVEPHKQVQNSLVPPMFRN